MNDGTTPVRCEMHRHASLPLVPRAPVFAVLCLPIGFRSSECRARTELTARTEVPDTQIRIAGSERDVIPCVQRVMLRSARTLEGFELAATDGRIGHVVDLLFDDRRWTVRYLVVGTGKWLDEREVLISPHAIRDVDWPHRAVSVQLSRPQVEESPAIDPDEPVSKEQELQLAQYYDWPLYWGTTGFTDGMLLPMPPFLPVGGPRRLRRTTASSLDEPHHVRSMADVRGYRVEANDGEIGHVDDFVVDDAAWTLEYLVVDTRNWWPGSRVLVAPTWVFEVGWDEAKVFVDLSREAIRHSPKYDPAVPLTATYTDRLHEHYGLPRRNAEP